MRKINLITILMVFSFYAKSQNGITTNPSGPSNPQVPSKTNTFFNWTDSIYQFRSDCKSPITESPFFKTDNLEALRVSKDMLPKDGWELIRRTFGLTEQNTATPDNVCHPDYILYNKYTSILRIIVKICKTCRNEDFNAAKITISFDAGTKWKTDLLAFSRKDGLKSLDQSLGSWPGYAAGAEYYNDYEKWFYADFPMMYDPCTKFYESKLKIISELISTANITLEGKITGDIYAKNEAGKAKIQKTGSYSWDDLSSDFGKVKKVNASIADFNTETIGFAQSIWGTYNPADPKFAAIDSLVKILKNDKFLTAGLKAVPWLGTALGIFDAFFAAGKASSGGPQEVKLMPMTMNLTARLKGTLTKTAPYHNMIFNNPGAKNNELDLPIYPYYNEVLGVFNIIKMPEVKYNYTQQTAIRRVCSGRTCTNVYDTTRNYAFTIDTAQIRYAVNPSAGLTLQEMKVSLMFYRDTVAIRNFYSKSGDFEYYGIDAFSRKEIWRADDVYSKCLNLKKFTTTISKTGIPSWNAFPKSAYIQFILRFKRNSCPQGEVCQDVLHVLKFPASLIQNTALDITPTSFSCQDTIPLVKTDSVAIVSFCQTGAYATDITRKGAFKKTIPEELSSNSSISVFPNPADNYITIKSRINETFLYGEITSLNGTALQKFSGPILNGTKLYLKTSIKNGMYLLKLQKGNERKVIKIAIFR
jgi:hypothetical protein